MDTLALLCNLHADGPATLQRLRRAGCESLAALCRFDAATLAARLEWHERRAERFLREAILLGQRVEPDDAETLEPAEVEFELESAIVAEHDDAADEAEDEEDEPEEEAEGEDAGYAPPAERVAAVLGAWRELDRVAPPEEPREFVIPRPAPVADLRLDGTPLDGLTPRLVERLAELGIFTLRQLVEASTLELSRELPLGFTRMRHAQFLAERELERAPAPATVPAMPPARREVFETFNPPPVEPFETAGPFA